MKPIAYVFSWRAVGKILLVFFLRGVSDAIERLDLASLLAIGGFAYFFNEHASVAGF